MPLSASMCPAFRKEAAHWQGIWNLERLLLRLPPCGRCVPSRAMDLFAVGLLAAGLHRIRLRRKRQAEEERYL